MTDLEKQIIARFILLFQQYDWKLTNGSCGIYLSDTTGYKYVWNNFADFIYGTTGLSYSIFEFEFTNIIFGSELTNILKSLKSNSLEELQIKMDLAGV